jgi:predicted DNA-binding protein (UPF0251 family)
MRLAEELMTAEERLDPELALYRGRTVGLLKKYYRMSMELGHLPSVMGREFFRTHVTSYGTYTFEDAVIFVHDVDRCLEKVHKRHQVVVTRLFFQQYTNNEAADLMGCPRTTFVRWRTDALNAVTAIFMERGLLKRMPEAIYEAMVEAKEEVQEEVGDRLPPKKRVQGVKSIQAVAVSA